MGQQQQIDAERLIQAREEYTRDATASLEAFQRDEVSFAEWNRQQSAHCQKYRDVASSVAVVV